MLDSGDMAEEGDGLAWLGRYSLVAVAASLVVCYGTLALIALSSALGMTLSVHAGAWATLVVAFAWIGVLAMGVSLRRHGKFAPFLLADVGALMVSWVTLVDFHRMMELAGFALLVCAALWDRKLRLQDKPCRN